VVTGNRHLGGFIGQEANQKTWVEAGASKWAYAVGEMAYPQLQQEWQFLRRVTDGLSEEFDDIERALNDKFLPALFGIEGVSDAERQLACLLVKYSGRVSPS
jgi:hypothetical protein